MWGSALLALSRLAWAGACCAGSTSGVPIRVGECEHVVAGIGVGLETLTGVWSGDGSVAPSSLREGALLTTVGAGARWARWGQAGVQLPVRYGWRSAGDLHGAAFGAGDLSVTATVSAWEEHADRFQPRLLVIGGVRVPTGTSWDEADAPLAADVTGVEGWGLLGGISVERALGKVPWTLGVDVDAPVGGDATPLAAGASGSVGAYLGPKWTLLGNARYTATFAEGGTGRTTVGARLVRGERLRWRAWVGASVDPPVPGLGHSALRLASAETGLVWVR